MAPWQGGARQARRQGRPRRGFAFVRPADAEGFDPLEGGFRATGRPFEVFDQWIEVLPTDQVVAVEYNPPPIVPVP